VCSIAGFISDAPLERSIARSLCHALLYYGAERGNQSAGIYVNGRLAKRAMAPDAFTESSEFFNLFESDPSYALLHTRMPTCGGVGDAQAQPFEVNGTVSVHNGMYFNVAGIRHEWTLKKKSGVDSELVTRFVSSYGINRLPRFLESADGPSAVAVRYRDKLYLMRAGNPIVYATLAVEGTNLLVFASTSQQLMRALAYCWLLPSGIKARECASHVLLEASASGLRKLSGRMKSTVPDAWPDTPINKWNELMEGPHSEENELFDWASWRQGQKDARRENRIDGRSATGKRHKGAA
jgi:hypothetical protein